MSRRHTRCTNAIVTGGADRAANKAVIHDRGHRKPHGGVTSIARGRNRNVCRRLTNRKHTIVANFALGRQHFENATDMAGFTGNNIMLAFQWEASH